jgi:septal ring factor EnvC (AmiA/AmiB activator)
MGISIVVLYVMCFSLAISFAIAMSGHEKQENKRLRNMDSDISQVQRDVDRIEKKT